MGVDVDVEGVVNTMESGVWEPVVNKVTRHALLFRRKTERSLNPARPLLSLVAQQINSLSAATEAACVILSIDETVRNPR